MAENTKTTNPGQPQSLPDPVDDARSNSFEQHISPDHVQAGFEKPSSTASSGQDTPNATTRLQPNLTAPHKVRLALRGPRKARLRLNQPRKPKLALNPPKMVQPHAGLTANCVASKPPNWTATEDQALITIVRRLVAEGKTYTERGWDEASVAMQLRGFRKTSLACRNRWGRELREQTGLDERKPRAVPRKLTTGKHLPGARKKAYERKKKAKVDNKTTK